MNRARKIAASMVGAAAAVIVVSTAAAGTAAAGIDIPRPLPENCGKSGFSQVDSRNYLFAYELYKQEGNTYYYGVSVPNVPAGFVPIGESSCTKG